MFKLAVSLIALVLCLSLLCAAPVASQTLDGLKAEHPRLLADAARFEQIRRNVADDALAKAWYAELRQRGEEMLEEPVTRYDLRDGRRLLYESRDVKGRVLTLALLHRIEPDDRYVARVWADLAAAAQFPNWHPDHFLDVAEMAFAFAIAYDWLHEEWSDAQRQTIRDAIVEHGLEPGLLAYDQNAFFTRTSINWNQVCNGGLIVAALAVAEEHPQLATQMIDLAVKTLPLSMARYAPEGGYDEGPGYWGYGTSYNIFAIAALESALGHSFGLADAPGFDITGRYPIQLAGPTGRVFNFADGSESTLTAPALFYFARRYDQPACARYAAMHNVGSALDLLWYDPALLKDDETPLPLATLYEKVGVAALRSAWDDPNAMFLAVKAGPMPAGHGQLDLGSFIYEHHGVRWFIDLGADDYNLPGYFDQGTRGKRWQYYRNRAEGHNTLAINPDALRDQREDQTAPITLNNQQVHIDLSAVYGIDAQRTFDFNPEQSTVSLTDTLASESPAEVWWFAHTRAQIKLADDGRSAVLEEDGKQLRVTIHSPADARFAVMPAQPLPTSPNPPGQNPNDGSEKLNTAPGSSFVVRGEMPDFGPADPTQATRKLAIHLPQVTATTLRIQIESVSK